MMTENPYASEGRRLRLARESRKMSMGELADAIGISRQALALWEAGKSEAGAVKLYKAATELGTSIEWILTGDGEPPEAGNRAAIRVMIRQLERKLAALDAIQ